MLKSLLAKIRNAFAELRSAVAYEVAYHFPTVYLFVHACFGQTEFIEQYVLDGKMYALRVTGSWLRKRYSVIPLGDAPDLDIANAVFLEGSGPWQPVSLSPLASHAEALSRLTHASPSVRIGSPQGVASSR